MGPLEGLKVIDLTHVMAGPTCTLMLADMGADVIKVEKIPGGDDTRRGLPMIDGEAASFMMVNRNKRGIVLDLKTAGGKRVLKHLLADADVVVENYRPGTLARLGFDYEELRKGNPGLIYCALSGFGRTGPYGHRGGFDLVAQAMSGIMSITGEGPGRPPVKCGAPLTDITCGILSAMGILAAYAHRLQTGRGQMVETSLLEAGIVQTYWQSAIALASGVAPGPMGSAHPLNAPYQAFETADGWVVIGGNNQRLWQRTLEVLGAPELASDPRFRENHGRMATPEGARSGAHAPFQTPPTRPSCWPPSKRPACPRARSTTSSRCRPTPRSRRARWWSRSSTRSSGRSRPWACRSNSPTPRAASAPAPPSTASTPARSSSSTVFPVPKSTPSPPKARSYSVTNLDHPQWGHGHSDQNSPLQ